MAITTKAPTSITSHWHRQIFRSRSPQLIAARSPFVAASYIAQDSTCSTFVDINRLLIVLLYEEVVRTDYSPTGNQSPLRFSGYRVTRVPHGVCWGGAANSQFFKDLTLTPRPGGRHQRLDCVKTRMVELAERMDRRLARAGRRPSAPWPGLRLPRVWAGFRSGNSHELRGDGPEFEQACCDARATSVATFQGSRCLLRGLVLHPLDWVSSRLDQAVVVYAELTPKWRRQVFRIGGVNDLIGYRGASEFDFYHSRFRRLAL
jgi:hypothetical protein